MDVLESGQSEVGQDLAAKSARANDKDLALLPQELLDLRVAH